MIEGGGKEKIHFLSSCSYGNLVVDCGLRICKNREIKITTLKWMPDSAGTGHLGGSRRRLGSHCGIWVVLGDICEKLNFIVNWGCYEL